MFDEIIDRRNTDCIKYDDLILRFGRDDLIPMWVADMDFKAPDFIVNALIAKLNQPNFGYAKEPDRLRRAIVDWQLKRNALTVSENELILGLGVVQSIALCILAFSNEMDEVIIQTPVYTPFFDIIKNNNRVVVENPLIIDDGGYKMDLEHLGRTITPRTKMLILCSPHNPVGRVWSEQELYELCELCSKLGVIIISDEIHSDIIFAKHTPILKFDYDNLVLISSPSKTFNTPGISFSYAAIKNKDLYKKLAAKFKALEVSEHQIFNFAVALSAYENGASYVDGLVKYLAKSKDMIKNALSYQMTRFEPEATYLYWLDFKDVPNAKEKIYDKAKIALNRGVIYGNNGAGFYRMNFAAPHSVLNEALERLELYLH